ncbi:MAG: hypothetical protein AB1601_07210 [Planctomycetota bacterium]
MEIKELEVPGAQRSHFSVGLLGSLVGALIGAAVWAVVAIATNYQLGIIAWGLGALAGYGMARGHREGRAGAGITAALVAILGILAARVVMVSYLARDAFEPIRTRLVILSLPTEKLDRVATLAMTEAGQRAKREHRCPYDEPYWDHFYERATRLAALSDSELAAAYEKHREWSRVGRFEDAEYIRDTLPYSLLGDALWKVWVTREPLPAPEWASLYADAAKRAAALSPDEQSRECRRRTYAGEVASLECKRRAMERSVAPGDAETRVRIVQATWTDSLDMEDTALAEAFLKAESWDDEGQWNDPGWLRLRLAYLYAEHEWLQREGSFGQDEPLPGATWDTCLKEATERAAQVPEAEIAQRVRQVHNDQSLAFRQEKARLGQLVLAGTIVVAAVASFEWMDLLFGGLAVVTAYRVATAGTRTRDQPPPDAPPA